MHTLQFFVYSAVHSCWPFCRDSFSLLLSSKGANTRKWSIAAFWVLVPNQSVQNVDDLMRRLSLAIEKPSDELSLSWFGW
jgi:hypothetical protein